MRIKSDFKDYYDGVMRMGMDTDVLWVRKSIEKEVKLGFPTWCNSIYSWRINVTGYRGRYAIIGFCGKIYGCLILTTDKSEKNKTAICYSVEEVDKFVKTNWKKAAVEAYHKPKSNYWNAKWGANNRKSVVDFFKSVKELEDNYKELFIEHHTPIFIWQRVKREGILDRRSNYVLTVHACLKHVEFFRIMDPYTAFQELQMFYGGLASPEKPIPEISDADMLEAKGFCPRYSFRKNKSKK